MAKKKQTPVDPDAIDLQGKRKDAQLLERYALESGVVGLPFLERALAEGSQPLRVAATAAIAAIDAPCAEDLVFALIRRSGKVGSKAWKLAHDLLLGVATPNAIATFLSVYGVVKPPVPARVHAALVAHVVAEAPRLDREELRALLARSGVLADQGSSAFVDALAAAGVILDVDLALEASRFANGTSRFLALSRYVAEAPGRKAVARELTKRDDRAWIGVLAPFIAEREVYLALLELRDPVALEQLRATAARAVFDAETGDACYRLGQLGDELASPILLRWLEDPSAREAAAMLATALATCGDARSVPALERARALHPPGRAGFFDHAIRAIRARAGE